jgi:transcriptional regulator with XRE-family HTH domain
MASSGVDKSSVGADAAALEAFFAKVAPLRGRGPGNQYDVVRNFDGAAMLAARRRRKLSHDALGRLTEVPRSNLIAYEKGRRRPSPRRLVDLARALAALLDLPLAEYKSLERGEGSLPAPVAELLCDLFCVSVRRLRAAQARGACG